MPRTPPRDSPFYPLYQQVSEQVNNSPEALARTEYDRLSQPGYGANDLREMAATAAGGADTYLRAARATGGSTAAANELYEASRRRARQQAFEGYGALRLGLDRSRLGALGLYGEIRGRREDRESQEGSFGSFVGGVLGTGLGYAAGGFGGAAGGALGERLFK